MAYDNDVSVHLSIKTANMDDDEVLFVAGMAAAVVTVIASSMTSCSQRAKTPHDLSETSVPTAFRIRRLLQSADGRTPRKRHR